MPDFSREAALWRQGFRTVAGVDEAGRGPLAGPVVAAAVILPRDWPQALQLADSKRLPPERREACYEAVCSGALAWRAAVASPEEIDRVNILQATLAAMTRAVRRLRLRPEYVLVDGNRVPPLDMPCEAVVRGDDACNSVAAASIVAKVVRDRIMQAYGRRYPHWGFDRHKGYGTAEHREALRQYGPSPIHRRSFRSQGAAWQTELPWDAAGKP